MAKREVDLFLARRDDLRSPAGMPCLRARLAPGNPGVLHRRMVTAAYLRF